MDYENDVNIPAEEALLCVVPDSEAQQVGTSTRAFSVVAPILWPSLPRDARLTVFDGVSMLWRWNCLEGLLIMILCYLALVLLLFGF